MAQLALKVKIESNTYEQCKRQQIFKAIGKGCLKVLTWIGIALVMIICVFFYFVRSCLGAK